MLTKCANPECNTPFNYFNQGRLYEFDYDPGMNICTDWRSGPRAARWRQLFWLCGRCSRELTLVCETGQGIVIVPIEEVRHRRGTWTGGRGGLKDAA